MAACRLIHVDVYLQNERKAQIEFISHYFFDVFNNKGISKLSLEAQDVHYDSPTGFHITETKDPKSKHKVF